MSGKGTAGFVSDLQDAARDNPVSAVLIGAGLAWMLLGKSGFATASSMVEPAARSAAHRAGQAVDATIGAASSAQNGMRSMAAAAADETGEAVDKIGGYAKDAFESIRRASSDVTDVASETVFAPVVSNLKHAFERQPLLIGGIGLAIGSAIAAAFPQTAIEGEVMGDAAQRVSSDAGTLAEAAFDDVKNRAERALDAMGEEASAQNLTAEDAAAGAAAFGQKLKNVASAAQRSPKQP